jgi:methylenetetrahydrofolate--tRNA-(uracil-5-)-methyltransferase
LEPSLSFKDRPNLWFAGQITGVEGYMGNIATGLLAGINAARTARGEEAWVLPLTTMTGALCHYITHASLDDFQPMKANYGIFPPLVLDRRATKGERAVFYAQRALDDLESFLSERQPSIEMPRDDR